MPLLPIEAADLGTTADVFGRHVIRGNTGFEDEQNADESTATRIAIEAQSAPGSFMAGSPSMIGDEPPEPTIGNRFR